MSNIKDKLRSIIVEALHLSRNPDSIPDTNLITALGIDSINSLELLIWVENQFGISIDDDDLSIDLVDSLDVLAAYVAKKIERQTAPAVLAAAETSE